MNPTKKWFVISAICFLSTVALYQNCGKTINNPLQSGDGGATSNVPDRNYYLVQSGYTCVPMGGGAAIASYKGLLVVRENEVLEAGDKCNDAIAVHPRDPNVFNISSDGSQLSFNGETYTFMEAPPQ